MKKKHIIIGLVLIGILLVVLIYNFSNRSFLKEGNAELEITVTSDYFTGLDEWKAAETKFESFTQEHLNRMREIEGRTPRAKLPDYQFDREFIEIKSPIISKHLPNYRIFTEKHFNFALGKDGHIIGLGSTWPGGLPYESAPDFELMNESVLLSELGVTVVNEETAIEIVKLVDSIFYITGAHEDSSRRYWRMEGEKQEKTWIVTMNYIGPPEYSIMMPPHWEIIVDNQNKIMEFREKYPEI